MRRLSWGLLPMLALTFGCEDILDLGDDGDGQAPPSMIAPGANETPDTGSAAAPDPAPRSSGVAVPADFAGVRWLHTNVSGWPSHHVLNAASAAAR